MGDKTSPLCGPWAPDEALTMTCIIGDLIYIYFGHLFSEIISSTA